MISKQRVAVVLLLTMIFLTCLIYLLSQFQSQTVNLTLFAPDATTITVLVSAASTILGVFVGHMLTSRSSQEVQNKNFKRGILRGIRAILTELEDNEELVKSGKEVVTKAFDAERKESWFLPPIVNARLETELNEVYHLLAGYNEEVRYARNSSPKDIERVSHKYVADLNILERIHQVETLIRELSQRIVRKVWKW